MFVVALYLCSGGGGGAEHFDQQRRDQIKEQSPAVSKVMTKLGKIQACSTARQMCGARDGYFEGDLLVGRNTGVGGDLKVLGSIQDVTDLSVLRTLSVNGMANINNISVSSNLSAKSSNAMLGRMVSMDDVHLRGNLKSTGSNTRFESDAVVQGRLTNKGVTRIDGDVRVGLGLGAINVRGDTPIAFRGDVFTKKDQLVGGDAVVWGDVIVGRRTIVGKGNVTRRDQMVLGNHLIAGDANVGRSARVRKNAHVGGNVSVSNNVVVGSQAVVQGALKIPHGSLVVTEPGVDEIKSKGSQMRVKRNGGQGYTIFGNNGANSIAGPLHINGKLCTGTSCLDVNNVSRLLRLESFLNGRLDDLVRKSDSGFGSLSKQTVNVLSSLDKRFGDHDAVKKSTFGKLDNDDADAKLRIDKINTLYDSDTLHIDAVNQEDNMQDVRLERLEAAFNVLQNKTLNAMNTAVTTSCCPPEKEY